MEGAGPNSERYTARVNNTMGVKVSQNQNERRVQPQRQIIIWQ